MDLAIVAVVAVLVIALATSIAPKLGIAGPLILVLVGILVSLLPFVPAVEVDPDIILVGVLPPLLYSAAVSLPAIEFRRDFGPIAGLSVLLVVLSALALAFFFRAVIPGMDFLLALALGAILSPTDAVATSIVKRLGISRRVVTLLEGESLLNDATSLVLLRTAVAAALVGTSGVAGDAADAPGFLWAFVWGVFVALVVGALIGFINLRLRAFVHNSAANTAIGFVVPFAAYVPTEHFGGSGLVAAVVAGIVTGQGAARWFTPEQRLSDELNWRTIELMLEGAVFLIMGLELKEIVRQNNEAESGVWHGTWLALSALGIILVVRAAYVSLLVWGQSRRARDKHNRRQRLDDMSSRLDAIVADPPTTGPGGRTRDPAVVERRVGSMRRRVTSALADLDYYQASPLGWKHGTIIVWAGMRGVVTLAAAQTLPREGVAERSLLVFVAVLVAVGSLVLQGFTLPWLVRLLRIDADGESLDRDEQRRLSTELLTAATSALSENPPKRRDGTPFPAELLKKVEHRAAQPPDDDSSAEARDLLELRIQTIEVMRTRLNELSSGGTYSTPTLRRALAELDADQISLELRLDDSA